MKNCIIDFCIIGSSACYSGAKFDQEIEKSTIKVIELSKFI